MSRNDFITLPCDTVTLRRLPVRSPFALLPLDVVASATAIKQPLAALKMMR